MTNDMFLSLDLYKIVSDYSGVNQLKFPPTTIQILNALTAYIKTLQEKVDLKPRYFKQILLVANNTSSPSVLGALAVSFVSNVEKNSYTQLEIFEELYNLYGTNVDIPCWGTYILATNVQASILSIRITTKDEVNIGISYRTYYNGKMSDSKQLYSLTDTNYTTTCISTPLFVPARTDTI